MKILIVPTLSIALLASLPGTAATAAEHSYNHVTCRSGNITVLAKTDDMIVWSLDHRGVTQTQDSKDPFNGFTQRCVGVVANIAGKISANGWCRNVDPTTGDWTLVDWVNGDKPGMGTFSFRWGTGKWKGVSGGGSYQSLGQTKPVDAGTYQNCVRIKGTVTVPG